MHRTLVLGIRYEQKAMILVKADAVGEKVGTGIVDRHHGIPVAVIDISGFLRLLGLGPTGEETIHLRAGEICQCQGCADSSCEEI